MTEAITSQTLTITSGTSKVAHNHGLVISIKDWNTGVAHIVFGSPGAINVSKRLETGDAELYETREHGIVEVRLMACKNAQAEVLLTKISPRNGFATSIDASDEENRNFTSDEVLRIQGGIEQIKVEIAKTGKFSAEQEKFLASKFADMADASERLGRKDWIMYVSGTLTSVLTSAAFDPDAAKLLIGVFNKNLDWVFNNILRLLG